MNADEGQEPTPEQIEDFIMRTGADPAEARFFIEAAGGDVQAAATMFLESFPENMAHPGAQQHMNWDDGPQGVNHADDTATFQDVTQVADGNARGGGPVSTAVTYALSAPFLVIRGGFALVGAVLGLGWAVVNQVGTFLIGESNMAPLRRVVASLVAATGPTDPNHSARSFIASFESRFGPSRPPFEPVGCRAAIRKAHQQGKFLLVYLHDSNVSESVRFAETTLTDETIVSLIRENMLAWGGDVSTCWDAKQLQRAVGSPSAPYLAMVSMPSQDVVNLVASWEGRVDAARLANELLLSLERFGPELAAVQRRQEEERSRREADRRIREEQDRALQEALEADRAREAERREREEAERKAREEEERKREEEEREREEAERRAREAQELLEKRRKEKAEALVAEPEAGAPGCCTIRVRMPGGANESRRFLESHAMSVLYDWVDSLEQAGEPRMSVLYDWVDSLEQAEHVDYDLVLSYPRKTFHRGNSDNITLGEAGLSPQAALFVQPAVQE